MDGILAIDKPAGMTSHDVVARVHRILKTRRVGHTGTLDPFATGVLVLLIGRATRLAQFLDKDEKEYEAVIRFGFETDTGDITGVRSAECGMRNEEISGLLEWTDWETLFFGFLGEIEQIPPMYSAKKVKGQKLYDLARKGEKIDRKAIKVNIFKIELLSPDAIRNPQSAIRIKVVCSAGTYIRTLAEDMGKKIGVGAHLAELRRTRAGRFDLSESISPDDLASLDDPATALLPVTLAVGHLPVINLSSDRAARTRNGLSTRITNTEFSDGEAIQVRDEKDELIAVGFYNESEKAVQPKIVLG